MEPVFLKLLNLSLIADILIVVVILLRFIFRKAPKWLLCMLWGLPALRLMIPFTIESPLSLLPSAEPLPRDIIYTAMPQIQSGIAAVDSAVNPILAQSLAPSPISSANPTQILSAVLSWIWLIGVCGMLCYAIGSTLLLQRKLRTATRFAAGIRQSEAVTTPFVFGIFRPEIYLPYHLDGSDLANVIAHERAHICRKDHWWKPLGFLLLSIYWFNPLLWLAYALLCRDIEVACDEMVVRSMDVDELRAYASALVRCSIRGCQVAVCPLAFGEIGIKARVRQVVNYRKPTFWLTAAAIVLGVAAAVCFLTSPRLNMSDRSMVRQSYASAYACAAANHVAIDKNDAEVILHSESVSVVFPVVGSDKQIRVTSAMKNGRIMSQETVLEDRVLLLTAAPRLWFDSLHGDEMLWKSTREICLDEFPGVTFRWQPERLDAVTDDGTVALFTGMPIWSVYFYDLTGDGLPEICSTLSIGSGIIDNRILIFDYANGISYDVSDRGKYDFSLCLQDGTLMVEKCGTMQEQVLSSEAVDFVFEHIRLEDFTASAAFSPECSVLEEVSGYALADWDRTAQSGTLNELYAAIRDAAIGPDQEIRDRYVMSAILRSDGAYTAFLAEILAMQYQAAPDEWNRALTAFADDEAAMLQRFQEQ